MIKTHRAMACMLALLMLSASVQAAELAGMIKNCKGLVSLERGSEKLPVTVGSPVYVADRLLTGRDGAVGLTLRDSTLLSAGPNSVIVIEKFNFDSTTQEGSMSVGIRRGTLAVASGKIAKHTPESVDFHTPTSVLGVRGTEFVIEVGGEGE